MADEKLWFKFWASTYLTDPRIDRLTDAAAVLLQRMRCVCCLEGSCPVDTSEIARRTMRSESQVRASLDSVLQFFVQKADRLFDVGQERDNAVTERARKGANAANAKRKGVAPSDAGSDAPSDAQAKIANWLDTTDHILGRFPSSVAPSVARAVARSDAQKLEVRSKEIKNLDSQTLTPSSSSAVGERGECEGGAVETVQNVPHGTLLERSTPTATPKPSHEERDWGDLLVIPDGHGRYKPRSTTNTNTGQERREA